VTEGRKKDSLEEKKNQNERLSGAFANIIALSHPNLWKKGLFSLHICMRDD